MTDDIEITQEAPVSWLDPRGLLLTGIKTVEAAMFGAYADRREVIAALNPDDSKVKEPTYNYAIENLCDGANPAGTRSVDEVWFDFIADTGDGWNATYSIAYLSCAKTLRVLPPLEGLTVPSSEFPIELPRGRFVILGGDQVYPTASPERYKTRLEDPFFAARPEHAQPKDDRERKPADVDVYALPGNHDWYDGLTSFIRLFCQGRIIGCWQTWQTRSYFAIKLPHDWWIWGIDVQLESDIDGPQVEYFRESRQDDEGGSPCHPVHD